MNKLVFEVNNGRKLELVQREDNGTTLICSLDAPDNEAYISAGDFVQLIDLYRYCKRYDIHARRRNTLQTMQARRGSLAPSTRQNSPAAGARQAARNYWRLSPHLFSGFRPIANRGQQ